MKTFPPSLWVDSVVARTSSEQKQMNFSINMSVDQDRIEAETDDEDFLWIETYYGTTSYTFYNVKQFSLDTIFNQKVRIFASETSADPEYRLMSMNLNEDSIYYFTLSRGQLNAKFYSPKIVLKSTDVRTAKDHFNIDFGLPNVYFGDDSLSLIKWIHWIENVDYDGESYKVHCSPYTFNGLDSMETGNYEFYVSDCESGLKFRLGQFFIHQDSIYYFDVQYNSFLPEHEFLYGNDKPVIYLYSPDTLEFMIDLEINESISPTFEYPTPTGLFREKGLVSWYGTVVENQILIEGKKYPYLFWEGEGATIPIIDKGFCVSGDSVVEFLEQKIDEIGLNSTEKTDFITYWAPKMIKNNYNVVHFKFTEDYYDIAEMFVSPEPDAILRMYMYFRPVKESIKILPQSIPTFERKGFTVVEWGGSQLP